MKTYNCIIVGSGIAALQLANHISSQSRVLIVTKSMCRATNSYRAQGGIAAAIGNGDAPILHYEDTMKAGCHFHNEQEVKDLVESGPELIAQLKNRGLHFDEDATGQYALGMEGAHGQKRIVHCGGDATGKHVMEHLITSLRPGIEIVENRFVYELILHPVTKKCVGIQVKDAEGNNERFFANTVVLASGGIGGLFSFTSNDPSIAGDGIALAYRAGADIRDMEFIQFHPTLLYVKGQTAGLVSEAVRGEGGRLVDERGMPLMVGKHPLADLAPRHIVAQELFRQRLAGREVYLDISEIPQFHEKFPTITAMCRANGVPLEKGRIPVAPGCHFLMGGIVVDSVGRTSVEGLYAIGETASTGVHGANRLASNSLLEGLHYGKKLAIHLNERWARSEAEVLPLAPQKKSEVQALILPEKDELRAKMMAAAGIVRTRSELEVIDRWLDEFGSLSLNDIALDDWSIDAIQRLFMWQVAKLVSRAALLREESRGAHHRADFPTEDKTWGQLHIVQSKKRIEMRERQHEHYQVKVYA